jgi:hypothetical protein
MQGRSHAYYQVYGEVCLSHEVVEVAVHRNAYHQVVGVVVYDHPKVHLAADDEAYQNA